MHYQMLWEYMGTWTEIDASPIPHMAYIFDVEHQAEALEEAYNYWQNHGFEIVARNVSTWIKDRANK